MYILCFEFKVVEPINKMIERVPFDAFYYSLDWHPQDHISFIDNVKLRKLDQDSKVTLILIFKKRIL